MPRTHFRKRYWFSPADCEVVCSGTIVSTMRPPFRWLEAAARRPALAVAVLFILGIAAHRVMPLMPVVWLLFLACTLIAAAAQRTPETVCKMLLGIGCVSAGIATAQLSEFAFPSDHITAFVSDEPRLASLELEVDETPRVSEAEGKGRPMPARQTFGATVRRVQTWQGWVSGSGKIAVAMSPPAQGLGAGQIVRVLGRLQRVPPAMNPGEFDWQQYYRRRRVLAQIHVSRPYDVQILKQGHAPLAGVRDGVRGLLAKGFGEHRSADLALLAALVFGDRGHALTPTEEAFQHTGTTHLLASNGLRVGMLASIVYLLCRVLGISPRKTVLAVSVIVALFGFLTLPAAQAIRPVLLCAAVGVGLVGRRTVDSIQLLALAALIILVIRPLELYGAGFQLSFGIVFGLMVFTRPMIQYLQSWDSPDQRVLKAFGRQSASQRAGDWMRRALMHSVAGGLVAWLVAVPLVAYHFEQVNPWVVPLSVLLSPLVVLALGAGFAKIILTGLCPPLAGSWAAVAGTPAMWLRHAVVWLAKVPGCDLPVAAPPLWVIATYYVLLCLPLIQWKWPTVRLCARCAGGRLRDGAAAAGRLCGAEHPSDVIRITLLSVGAGQCAVIESPNGKVALLDAGSSSISDVQRTVLGPFLRHEGRASVDRLFLSHGDFDHIRRRRATRP